MGNLMIPGGWIGRFLLPFLVSNFGGLGDHFKQKGEAEITKSKQILSSFFRYRDGNIGCDKTQFSFEI